MATRAKKTPAKTTKKPAAAKKVVAAKKTTKAKTTAAKNVSTSAAKSSAKKTNSKASVVAPPATTKKRAERKPVTPLDKIRSLHITNFIAYVLLGVASLFIVGKTSAEVILSHQARDNFVETPGVVLGSASEVLFSLQYEYILVAALALGAIGSLLLATRLRKRYESGINAGISGFRWLFFGVSSALIVELASFMGGVQDLMTLKLVGGLVILASVLGWLSERENKGTSSLKRVAYYGSIFAYLLSLLPLLGSMFGTTLYGDERFGWNVYALGGVVLAGFIANLVVQKSSFVNKAKYEYTVFELRYIRIDQIVKFLAVLILVASIK